MTGLPAPPRHLQRTDLWSLRLGTWSLFLGLLASMLVSLFGWTLVAAYGVKFSSLRRHMTADQVVTAQVEQSGPDRLWSGEPVYRTSALFQQDSSTYRALGYGEPRSPLGAEQAVDVVFSSGAPEYAWIVGLDPYPIRLSLLAQGLAIGLAPGLLLTMWGLAQGNRDARLVQQGPCVPGRRTRHFSLPRPFTGILVTRYRSKEEDVSGWSVGPDPGETPTLFSAGRGKPALVCHLLPGLTVDGQTISGLATSRRLRALTALGLILFQLLLLLGFVLT